MINKVLHNAAKSSFHRWLVNRLLWWKIPFNSAHRIRIEKLDDESVLMILPFIRKNKNHINSMHACALATLCEYVSGIQMARLLDTAKYRLILQQIHMNYKYQAKRDVKASFTYSAQQLENEILNPLKQESSTVKTFAIEVNDGKELICIGEVTWQIKRWDSVKTKV